MSLEASSFQPRNHACPFQPSAMGQCNFTNTKTRYSANLTNLVSRSCPTEESRLPHSSFCEGPLQLHEYQDGIFSQPSQPCQPCQPCPISLPSIAISPTRMYFSVLSTVPWVAFSTSLCPCPEAPGISIEERLSDSMSAERWTCRLYIHQTSRVKLQCLVLGAHLLKSQPNLLCHESCFNYTHLASAVQRSAGHLQW